MCKACHLILIIVDSRDGDTSVSICCVRSWRRSSCQNQGGKAGALWGACCARCIWFTWQGVQTGLTPSRSLHSFSPHILITSLALSMLKFATRDRCEVCNLDAPRLRGRLWTWFSIPCLFLPSTFILKWSLRTCRDTCHGNWARSGEFLKFGCSE